MRHIATSIEALSGADRSGKRSWLARLPPTRFLRTVRYVISTNFAGKKSRTHGAVAPMALRFEFYVTFDFALLPKAS
jgi:hypothetical protein